MICLLIKSDFFAQARSDLPVLLGCLNSLESNMCCLYAPLISTVSGVKDLLTFTILDGLSLLKVARSDLNILNNRSIIVRQQGGAESHTGH